MNMNNGRTITFRKEDIQSNQTEMAKELMNQINRTQDKNLIVLLLNRVLENDIRITEISVRIAELSFKETMNLYKERLEAYQKQQSKRRTFSLFPERKEKQIAEQALEDIRPIVNENSANLNSQINNLTLSSSAFKIQLGQALVKLLEDSPNALENLKQIIIPNQY